MNEPHEEAVVIDIEGHAIHWHCPRGVSGGAIPDSRELWDVLWDNRSSVAGVAHTHPFDGPAYPSLTDLTTFEAVEAGLGRRLVWWIVTFTEVGVFRRGEDGDVIKTVLSVDSAVAPVLHELRERSRGARSTP